MFTLPALLYIKSLPLFGQCLYHLIVPNKFRPLHAGGVALSPLVLYGLAPFLGRPGQCGCCCATPAGGRVATAYDLAANRPHTRRVFRGIGFRACDPPVPRWRPYH
ncbi:hypothetical protein AVEN_274684-1 [Araneus ventricosus]|uniref:Uncharacterized protein n=1 Tax=Araneus ventricosus TaxID=182803 RepID=A0A4Y2J0Q4_ARAVE|nr:hypothetical protein AVEN_56226-1 [Araneus ventricosus]GBN83343.1 hypothetical protein AVEN_274684-1 [Araneus ventricosus]